MSETTKSESVLMEMAVLGDEYRENEELEIYGEEVTVRLKPLDDKKFLPILSFIADHFDIDMSEDDDFDSEEAVQENLDEVSEEDELDVSKFDEEFIDTMQLAAVLGVDGAYDEDGNFVKHSKEDNKKLVKKLMGGESLKLGREVLSVTGDARDAEAFR